MRKIFAPLFFAVCSAFVSLTVVQADGRAGIKIIDGNLVPATQYPAVALINLPESLCTGTLITPKYVLTAGHCVYNDSNRVISASSVQAVVNNVSYNVAKVTPHPTYVPREYACTPGEWDAALLELQTEVSGVTPISIWREAPVIGTELFLAGFGTQGPGSTGENGTLPDSGFVNTGTTILESVDNSAFVSWTFRQGRQNTASGDSGGPAFLTSNGTFFLQSITCGGTGNSEYGTTSTNTRVDTMASWIDSVISGTPQADPPVNDPSGSLSVTKAIIDFGDNADYVLTLRGTISVGSGFNPNRSAVTVNFGGHSETFKLNKKGYWERRTGYDYFQLSGKISKNKFVNSTVKLTLAFGDKAALYNTLYDLFPEEITDEAVSIPVTITVNGVASSATLSMHYKRGDRFVHIP